MPSIIRLMSLALMSMAALMFRTDDPAPGPGQDDDRPLKISDLRREIRTLMAGDPDAAAEKLANIMADNQKYRHTQHRLTPEQWQEYQAMKALGRTPAEIKADLDRIPTLESDLQEFNWQKTIKDVAKAAKIENTDALGGLMAGRQFEIVEIPQADGSKAPQVLIVEGANKTPIREYVKARMAWAEPVLFAEQNQQAPQGGADSNTAGAAQGAAQNAQPTGAAQGAARPILFAQGNGQAPAQGAASYDPQTKAQELNEARNAGVKNPFAMTKGA